MAFLLPFVLGLAACGSEDPSGPGSDAPPQARGLPGCWQHVVSEKRYSRLNINAPDSVVLMNARVDSGNTSCSWESVNTLRTTWREAGDSLVLDPAAWRIESRCGTGLPQQLELPSVRTPLPYVLHGDDTLVLQLPDPWYADLSRSEGTTARTYTRCPEQ